jgi:Peptidase family M28/PA domain
MGISAQNLGWRLLSIAICLSLSMFAQESNNGASLTAIKTIRVEALRGHMRFLSDSLLQGRYPGTPGYDIAALYVATQLESMGIRQAGDLGTWYQKVRMVRAEPDDSKSSLILIDKGKETTLKRDVEYGFFPDLSHTQSDVEAPVVFVGFGITAPELNYDDYTGVDVHGKIVAFISNAPSRFPPTFAAYYGFPVQKARNAVAHGAVGLIEIFLPENDAVSLGSSTWLDPEGKPYGAFPEIRAWAGLTRSGAERLFANAPRTIEQAFTAAREGTPQAFSLPIRARMKTVNKHQNVESSNVVGKIVGSDPILREQYVIYSAHIDHLGTCGAVAGSPDAICHGTLDDASGVAAVLEIARAFASLPVAPRRSVLFLFSTDEEDTYGGADYFAHYPTIPAKSMVANINIDIMPGMRYDSKDLMAIGGELSNLHKNAEFATHSTGYSLSGDVFPERNYFSRGDHYSFALQGVPAIQLRNGLDGDDVARRWIETRYHTPLDNFDQPIDYGAGVRAAGTIFMLGYDVAQQEDPPAWNIDDPFVEKVLQPNRERRIGSSSLFRERHDGL